MSRFTLVAEKFNLRPDTEPKEDQKKDAQKQLINRARDTFTGELNKFIENIRKSHEQIIDDINLDEVTLSLNFEKL